MPWINKQATFYPGNFNGSLSAEAGDTASSSQYNIKVPKIQQYCIYVSHNLGSKNLIISSLFLNFFHILFGTIYFTILYHITIPYHTYHITIPFMPFQEHLKCTYLATLVNFWYFITSLRLIEEKHTSHAQHAYLIMPIRF